MVNTRSQNSFNENINPPTAPEPITQQLAAIVSKLDTIDSLAAEVAALKAQNSNQGEASHGSRDKGKASWVDEEDAECPWWMRNPAKRHHTKMEFPKFEGGDPRGWILKAEKYFRYYQTPDELKVDIAAMYLEGDALDLFAWINSERTLLYWEELVKALQENYGPAEFQNPDEHLCNIKQTSSIQEYRQEFAKRASRVTNWPEHCLLGVFLSGLKEELKAEVRIHKPRSVYKAMSLALEFEGKSLMKRDPPHARRTPTTVPNFSSEKTGVAYPNQNRYTTQLTTRPWEAERQARRDKGLCFRCNERFAPGHRCKSSALALLEVTEDTNDAEDTGIMEENQLEDESSANMAEISLNAIMGRNSGSTMKLEGRLGGR